MNDDFIVYFNDNHDYAVLPHTASCWNNLYSLEELENELALRKNEREEQARRANLKSAALAKLTKEEREVLGL